MAELLPLFLLKHLPIPSHCKASLQPSTFSQKVPPLLYPCWDILPRVA